MRQIELNEYPNEEFLHIDWHTSGALANGSGASRASFYAVSGVPDVHFDGVDHVVGAGSSTSVYTPFLTRIQNHLAIPPTVFVDAEVNFGDASGAITVDVEVAPGQTIATPSGVRIRAAVYENDISLCCEPQTGNDWWNYVARAMVVDQVLTISNAGEQQHVSTSFPIDPSWDPNNLHAVAWVQRNTTKEIFQAAKALQPYGVSVANLDALVTSTDGSPAEFDTEVTYTGSTDDDVVVTLDKSALPAGWDAELHWGAITNPSTIVIPGMTMGQMEPVSIRVIPDAAAGLGQVTCTTAPATNPDLGLSTEYAVFSNTPAILYVDDDNGDDFGPYFEDALDGAGQFYLVRDVMAVGDPEEVDLLGYDAVVWSTGYANFNTILPDAQQALQTYLDAGGTCFISSQGLLAHIGLNAFTQDYFGVGTITTFAGATSATGVAGDPIGDGLSFPLSPPFFDLADVMTPGTGTIWLQGNHGGIGMRTEGAAFRTVLMSAGFEGVPAASSPLVMGRILDWLLAGGGGTDVQPGESPSALSLALWQNTPNPFRGTTRVRFAVPGAGPVRITVYDVTGRRVADLLDRSLPAGEHSVVWNGADAAGRPVASGVYLYRLQTATGDVSKEMVLTR